MTTYKDDLEERSILKKKKEVDKKYKELLDEYAKLKKEFDAALEIKRSARTHQIPRGHKNGTTRAVAFAVASDWHVEELVDPRKINGMNKYNPEIAKKRANYFFQKVARMVEKERQDAKIETLVLALLGDFISGNIHDELLENCAMRPIEAIVYAEELLASGIEFLLNNLKCKLVIPCHTGNHSRITRKIHISTESGNSLEYMMYHHLKMRFREVDFVIADGYHSYLDVFGYTVRMHHGHAIRYWGGVGGPTIPINKSIAAWNLTKQADVDLLGHLHDYTCMRRFVMNGSLIGYSPFALAIKAEYQPAIQSFFLMDEKRGKTVQIPIVCE